MTDSQGMGTQSDSDRVVNYLLSCQRVMADHLSDGGLKKDRETYARSVVQSFHYTNRGIINVNYDSELVSREIWSWREYQELLRTVFPGLPEYAQCVDDLAERYNVPQETLGKWLSRLTHDATNSVNPVDHGFLRERADWLLNDARQGPVTWKARLLLQCVTLEGEAYELGKGIVIRRPRPSDLECEVHLSGPKPSAIVEYVFQASPLEIEEKPFLVERKTETLLQILRLYKVGSIESITLEYAADSYKYHGGTVGTNKQNTPHVNAYSYSIGQADVETLSGFIATLLDRIPSYLEMLDPPKKPNILGIPLPRYADCLIRDMSVEERIASAITCFEGLYLTDSDKGDIAYKFAQRLALTMRHFGFDPRSVAEEAGKAYGIRSKFVHGVLIKDKDRKAAFQQCDILVNYARISMVLCLQLENKDNDTKSQFLKLLDYAMLDIADSQQLQERIASKSFVPHPTVLPVRYLQLEESQSVKMTKASPPTDDNDLQS